jgi:twinkle protein
MNAEEVKIELAAAAENVCLHLLPNGKRKSNEWHIGSLNGEAGSSMRVHLDSQRVGVWADFHSGDKGSNLLELWRAVKDCTFKEALDEAKEYLGVSESYSLKSYAKPKPQATTTVPADKAIENDTALCYFNDRGISTEVVDRFDVRRVSWERQGDALAFVYWDDNSRDGVDMVKYLALHRENGKKKIWTSKNSRKTLYGKHTVTDEASTLVITEGELDAMTYVECGINACSVPFGAKWESETGNDPNMEWIQNDYEFLERFDVIAISMDMDEAGRRATASIVKRLGATRCRIIQLEGKDANETLMDMGRESIIDSYNAAVHQDPESLNGVLTYKGDVHDLLYSDVGHGTPLPWSNIPFHLRLNELTVVTGFNGSGKTMVLNYLCIWLASLGKRMCIASLEVPVKMNLSYLVRQSIGQETPSETDFDKSMDWLSEHFWFYDHVGQCNADDVLDTFAYAYKRYGITFFVVDSFMKLGFGVDEYNKHKEFMDQITAFVNEYDVHVFLVAHARKKESERMRVDKHDVKGTTEMTDEAHNCITVWRNKQKEEEIYELRQTGDEDSLNMAHDIADTKYDSMLSVVKQRNGNGEEPTIKLWYDKNTRQFSDKPITQPINYIK